MEWCCNCIKSITIQPTNCPERNRMQQSHEKTIKTANCLQGDQFTMTKDERRCKYQKYNAQKCLDGTQVKQKYVAR